MKEEATRLVCDSGEFRVSDARAPKVITLEINVRENNIMFSFETDLPASSSIYSGTGHKAFSLTHKELQRLPHEIVAQCRGLLSTDERMSSIEVLRNATDRLTPDCIREREDGTIEVLEIKTSKTTRNLEKLFESTRIKYFQALESRSYKRNILFCILIVTPHGVFSNIVLDQIEIDVLVSHYLFALNLLDSAKALGWNPEREFDEEIKLRELFSTMAMPTGTTNCRGEEEPLHINEAMVNTWKGYPLLAASNIFDANKKAAKDSWKTKLNTFDTEDSRSFSMFCKRAEAFKEEMSSYETKEKVSSLIHHPIIEPFKCSPYDPSWRTTEVSSLMIESHTSYGKLWSDAIRESIFETKGFEELLSTEAEAEIMTKGYWKAPPGSVTKSKRYVVKLEMTPEQRIDFACRGVQAKKEFKNPLIEEKREETKKCYNFYTCTDDIDRSFESISSWLIPRSGNEYILDNRIKDLTDMSFKFAGDIAECPNEKFVKDFCSTKLGRALCFLNDVLCEVNISRLKNVKRDCFVLKRLPNYKAYVLVKPTTSDKQVFYSVMIPKSEFLDVHPMGEDLIDLGSCYCTKFVSIDRHKISHLLYCQYKLASLYAFWAHQFSEQNINLIQKDSRVEKHFWMSALIFLEDKEKTSTTLQLIRYSYMEVVKGGIFLMDPGKIFAKIDSKIRSRLMLYCLKRYVTTFSEMCLNPPRVTKTISGKEALASEDIVGSLLSWVDGLPVKNFEVALNLSYLGVLHNKEEGDLVHGYLKIFDKVIDQERKLYDASIENMTIGTDNIASNLKDHEFSASAVKSFSNATKQYLAKKHGNYESWANSAFSNALLKKTFEDFATSKASAPEYADDPPIPRSPLEGEVKYNEIIANWKAGKEGRAPNPSYKCIENVHQLVESAPVIDDNPFNYLPLFLDDLETSGGINVKLFKKLQIGGTREIFILPIKARIAVNYLETICRTICEELPCEMLTKGDQKVTRSDIHFKKKAQACGPNHSITAINSDDAATWAQRFVMPVFGVMLTELVPEPFLTPCIRILNLITSKRLTLPTELLKLFQSYKTTESYNDNMNLLKKEFMSADTSFDRILVSMGSNLMKNRSNMMQGILHYTSSLLHSCFMMAFTMYIEHKFNSAKPLSYIKCAVATGKVSSDDSSLILSLVLENPDAVPYEFNQATVAASAYCNLKGFCYPLFCAKQSTEKSTVANLNLIEEFNSLWYFRNTLLSPSIKFVAASIRTHVTDKFEARQNVMAGLRSQVLENTGSIYLTSIIMSCQIRAHYIALGALANPLFPLYASYLRKIPHPALGFFLTEHHLICGLMNPKFSLYNAVRSHHGVSNLTKLLLSNALLMTEQGSNSQANFSFTQGSKERYDSMLNRMNIDYDGTIDYYDNNPELLYSDPRTKAEILKKIELKATTPSLSNAFEFLTDSKQHAASSYVLQSPCVFVKERKMIQKEGGIIESEVTSKKISLCGLVVSIYETLQAEPDVSLTPNEKSMIFPNASLYNSMNLLAKTSEEKGRYLTTRDRKLYISVHVPKFGIQFLASPSATVKSKWFGQVTKYSAYEIDQTWKLLRSICPWMAVDYNETLERSPLDSSISIAQFVRSLPIASSSIRVLAPVYKKTSIVDTMKEMVHRAQWPGIVLQSETLSATDISLDVFDPDLSASSPADDKIKPATWKENLNLRKQREMEPSFLKTQCAHELETALWYESALPEHTRVTNNQEYTPNVARSMRIMTQAKPILSQEDCSNRSLFAQLQPHESSLAIIQAVRNYGMRDVSPILECAKRGLIGRYTRRADYDDSRGMYVGAAEFTGTFNGTVFCLHSYDEMALKLELGSRVNVKSLFEGFARVVGDLRCNFKADFDDLKRAGVGPFTEFVDLRTGTISRAWSKGKIIIVEACISRPRIMGTNVRLYLEEGVFRLVDEHSDRFSRGRVRSYSVLSFKPRRPRDIVKLVKFSPFKFRTAIGGLAYDPFDIWCKGSSASLKTGTALLELVVSRNEVLLSVYPEIEEWVRTTLMARAESIADIVPSSSALSNMLYKAPYEETDNIVIESLSLDDEEHAQEFFNLDNFADDSGEESEYEQVVNLITERTEEDMELNSSFSLPSQYCWADYDPEESKDSYTDMYAYRPSMVSESGLDANRRAPFWDRIIQVVKSNSSHETRNYAFRGQYSEGASFYVKLVAMLYGATEPTDNLSASLDEDFD